MRINKQHTANIEGKEGALVTTHSHGGFCEVAAENACMNSTESTEHDEYSEHDMFGDNAGSLSSSISEAERQVEK